MSQTKLESNSDALDAVLTEAQNLPSAGVPTETLTLVRRLLGKAVYTEDVTADLAALDALLGGGELPDEPDEPVVPPEVVTEVLTAVWAKNYPNKTTFEYEEIEGEVGEAASKYIGYSVFKQSIMTGGVLHIDLDNTRLSAHKVFIYLYQNGEPYRLVGNNGGQNLTHGELVEGGNVQQNELNGIAGWIFLDGPATYQIPDGCTVMVGVGMIAGTSTILDESLMIDGSTTKTYKVFDAIKAGEVVTVKVVKEV